MNNTASRPSDRALRDIRGGRWTSALQNADAAIASGQDEPWLHRLRAVALTNLGDANQAEPILDRLAREHPAPSILHELVTARLAREDLSGAREAVITAVDLDASNVYTRRASALLAMRNGDWQLAERELRAAVVVDEFDVEALNNLSITLARLGHDEEATECMELARTRGRSTPHWQLLEHNCEVLALRRRREEVIARGAEPMQMLANTREPGRPITMGTLIRARYEAHKNAPPLERPRNLGRGLSVLTLVMLVLLIAPTLIRAGLSQPWFGIALVAVLCALAVLWRREHRKRRTLMVIPTSTRLRFAASGQKRTTASARP